MTTSALPALFLTQEDLHDAFVAGLERQLDEPGLGTFILVLANASFDAAIWPRLKGRLGARFAELSQEVRTALIEGHKLPYPDDDLMVFLKLMAMGFEAIAATESRRAGPWELQFNGLRALRPARASGMRVAGSAPPDFNANGFQFNKPFLRPEILWEGGLLGHTARILYNKFPFAPLHGLLVPEPERQLPQQLSQEMHLYAWHVAKALGRTLPGVLVSYNSYGAYASVNHLHFQLAVRDAPLPLLDGAWAHNGGATPYPLPCQVFTDSLDAWFQLDRLNQAGQAYNLVYTPDRLHCLPRQLQGGYEHAHWTPGYAWYEVAGGVTCFSRSDFDGLDAAAIAAELAKLSLAD